MSIIKKTLIAKLILFVLFTLASCKTTAQTVIVRDIADMKTEDWQVDGPVKKYFKDINNHFTPFLGTWFAQIGTQTFVVTLWKETKTANGNPVEFYSDDIVGHYRLVENYHNPSATSLPTSAETVIYTSDKYWRGTTQPMPFSIISMTSIDGIHSSAIIMDVSFPDNSPYHGQEGWLGMKILTTSPTTKAHWRISKASDAKPEDRIFNIPTDIILTKVN